jgi:hypothetical protein
MMYKICETIRSLYPVNLLEGEGVGTSYEYFVKLKKLERFINTIGSVNRILIAGLPERYGLSMDFFLIGQLLQAEIEVRDERPEALERARDVHRQLQAQQIFSDQVIEWEDMRSLKACDGNGYEKPVFDLALSSEVIQRLGDDQTLYARNLMKLAAHYAVFAPNRINESHAKISGLQGISLEELQDLFQDGSRDHSVFDQGYIDLPPFPPGISRSEEKREQASQSRIESIAMKGLEVYGRLEHLLPHFIKRKLAHIVYIMGNSRSEME